MIPTSPWACEPEDRDRNRDGIGGDCEQEVSGASVAAPGRQATGARRLLRRPAPAAYCRPAICRAPGTTPQHPFLHHRGFSRPVHHSRRQIGTRARSRHLEAPAPPHAPWWFWNLFGEQAVFLPLALGLCLLGLGAFLWSLKTGQYDDLEGAVWRAMVDDDGGGRRASDFEVSKSG